MPLHYIALHVQLTLHDTTSHTSKACIYIYTHNVANPMINLSFGDGIYNRFMGILGIVYYWVDHITHIFIYLNI